MDDGLRTNNLKKIDDLVKTTLTNDYKKTELLMLKIDELEKRDAGKLIKRHKKEVRELVSCALNKINIDYFKYLKLNCELNLRKIIEKYLNDELLSEEEIEAIRGYDFFSSLTFPHCEPGYVQIEMINKYGSGDFNQEEIELIRDIFQKARSRQLK